MTLLWPQCDLTVTLVSWLLMLDRTNLSSCPEMWPVLDIWPSDNLGFILFDLNSFHLGMISSRTTRCGQHLTFMWPWLYSLWPWHDLFSCPEMWPVFWRSNTRNASRISSSESVLCIFLAIMLRNSGKSTVPLPVRTSSKHYYIVLCVTRFTRFTIATNVRRWRRWWHERTQTCATVINKRDFFRERTKMTTGFVQQVSSVFNNTSSNNNNLIIHYGRNFRGFVAWRTCVDRDLVACGFQWRF